MTEQEAIKEFRENIELPFGSSISNEASEIAISALEEIQQYRALGTRCSEGECMERLSERFMYYCGILAGHRDNPDIRVDDLKHIRNLIEAEEQGLLLKLPKYEDDYNTCIDEILKEDKRADNKMKLSTLKPGDVFKMNDIEYIVLEQFNNDTAAIIRKNLLEDEMKFDSENNNWETSSIRRFLNKDYLDKVSDLFGEDNIVEHTVDLLSLDGLNDYGTSTDKVSLLTIDQYRKYRKVIGEDKDSCWWLSTPDSTPSGCGSGGVRCVGSGGVVCCSWCGGAGGVRPFFVLKSSIFVSCDKVDD